MRNLFDQYSQPENRITHALMAALDEDRQLLDSFLREVVKVKPPARARNLALLEQQYPWTDEPPENELERRGIPDGWIYSVDDEWCVIIESKVLTRLHAAQIESHRRTAKQRGFRRVTAIAIVPHLLGSSPAETILIEWRDVYDWLCRHSANSAWAARAAEFLEIAEAKLIETQQFVEGALTKFAGFPFDREHPYTYLEGKRILGLALGELRARKDLRRLGMNPAVSGRPAITGRQGDAVWNFLSLSHAPNAENFTKYPHLTLGITSQHVSVMVTVPNAMGGAGKMRLKELGEDGFRDLVQSILANMKPMLRKAPEATPWFRGVQRRYPSQKAQPYIDAQIDFDLRTAMPSARQPKAQPAWLAAAYGVFVSKRGTNYQIQLGAHFRYDRCPQLRNASALELVAGTWLACRPLIELMRS